MVLDLISPSTRLADIEVNYGSSPSLCPSSILQVCMKNCGYVSANGLESLDQEMDTIPTNDCRALYFAWDCVLDGNEANTFSGKITK
jgi:hypothetical protein